MARPREPADLIKAKGRTHMTDAEYEARKEQEIDVPYTNIHPPDYLTGKKQIEKFNYYANMLLGIGIFTELDTDCLARYIMSEQLYLQYTNLLVKLIRSENYDELSKIQTLQDRAFRQCHSCARSLGLTITERARLVVPKPSEDDDDEL